MVDVDHASDRPVAGVRPLPHRVTVDAAHRRVLPVRPARVVPVPAWLGEEVTGRLAAAGVMSLWSHQAEALAAYRAGANVVMATGTASGKSLIYQCAATAAAIADDRATVLYLAPTKALGHDQARAMAWTGLRVGVLDGDTPSEERDWINAHAQVVISNPDMLNVSVLPRHQRWRRLLRQLRIIVIDECHVYRGVFGSHTALILRRLLRLARAAGADPQVIAASATAGAPGRSVARLIGADVVEVTDDASPRGSVEVVLRAPADHVGSRTEVAEVLAALVADDRRSLAFVPSRAGAEWLARRTRELLPQVPPGAIRAYRAGLLSEERRGVEAGLRDGSLRAVATTNALELGMDIAGLDAVVLAGWPGRQASFWQQIGRAGRAGSDGIGVLVADDDPLDHYFLTHPEAVFDQGAEATVIDPANPRILRQHLVAAAAEAPLTAADEVLFGEGSTAVIEELVADGVLRRRPAGVFWSDTRRPEPVSDIRAIGGSAVRIVEQGTGRLLGTVDGSAAPATMHAGAVYVHQGEYYLVLELDLDAHVAMVAATDDTIFTMALSRKHLDVVAVEMQAALGEGMIRRGDVAVTTEVYAYQRRRSGTGEVLSSHTLDLPLQTLATSAVWWSWPDDVVTACAVSDVGGAAHAAEHAAIGMLPLVATCDRWDVGGLSTALHPATGEATVFIYDGYPGGVGYAARGFEVAGLWLTATRDAVASCGCDDGCPRCVQSPKCGNGNNPLDKAGAVRLLGALLG